MRLPAWIPLGVALLLIGFELSMLAIGRFGARVSPEYQAYFIDQRTSLWGKEVAAARADQDVADQEAGLTSR
jgi:hypothetical protein